MMTSPADDTKAPSDGEPAADGPSRAATVRRTFIEQSATALGQTWAAGCREELHREGRPAAGGWPGTLREARTRVGHVLPLEMRRCKMTAMTEEEREIAARAAYASARTEWLKRSEPETD